MTARLEALRALKAKYEDSLARIPDSVEIFAHVSNVRAARLAASAVTEEVLKDLIALIALEEAKQ